MLSIALFVDILSTVTMVWTMYSLRTGTRRTDSMIYFLTIYSLNTGVSTSVVVIVALLSVSTCVSDITNLIQVNLQSLLMRTNLIYGATLIVGTKSMCIFMLLDLIIIFHSNIHSLSVL